MRQQDLPADPGARRQNMVAVVGFGLALAAARFLAAHYGGFYEGDDISIAAGVAAMRIGSAADFYRYGPQVGYYNLVALLSRLTGGEPLQIPNVMVSLSVVSGVAIPLLGLAAFRADLRRAERWLLAAVLAANPILWMSSQYGNSAMPSVALTVGALVILSNRPGRWGEAAALLLLGIGIVVRADAVLASGAATLLLWRNHGRLREALVRMVLLGATLAAVYALFLVADPRMAEFVESVRSHLQNAVLGRFWEFLLWAFSPVPLVFAVLGLRELAPARPWMFWTLVAWAVPFLGFYFTAATTPRYFLQVAFPLSIAAAVGMLWLVAAVPRFRMATAVLVLGAAFVHLLIGLGDYVPSHRAACCGKRSCARTTARCGRARSCTSPTCRTGCRTRHCAVRRSGGRAPPIDPWSSPSGHCRGVTRRPRATSCS